MQAERSSPRAALEPGFRFCQGLLHRYMNDPRAALRAFNMARRDPEWGELAVQVRVKGIVQNMVTVQNMVWVQT